MSDIFSASSSGRLDVMGGIADYSGSLVLQMPIQNRTTVSIRLRDDFQCHLKSTLVEGSFAADFDYQKLTGRSYPEANKILNQDRSTSWIAYILGCCVVLEREKGIQFKGADFTIESNVPLGKGVSSSAAIEVATMKALAQVFKIDFSGTELPVLAQRVENLIVGAPCGLMDQLASHFAKPGSLLPIVCQPDLIQSPVSLPKDLHFIGIDSGVRHAVTGASYSDVRCAAFMGYSIIAQHLNVSHNDIESANQSKDWRKLPYKGYLSNITTNEFETKFKTILPQSITGSEFIGKYKYTSDSVTSINPSTYYNILNSTSHPVYENQRVHEFKSIIESFDGSQSQLKRLGELMYQSHTSYSRCRLGSERTDEIVNLSREFSNAGIYGAKITGGGSGGAVCLLAYQEDGIQSAKKIHQMMEEKYQTKLGYFD